MQTITKFYETDKKHKVNILKKVGNDWVVVDTKSFINIYNAEPYAECLNRDFFDQGKKATMKAEVV